MTDEKIDTDKIALDAARMVGLFGPTAAYRAKAVEVLALIRAVRAMRRCHPDTFVSTPDEVEEYIEAASVFVDSAEVRSDAK